uniref:Uncharacterized protein n=1 Tax=Lepeophtheirus salmonis TaxID=72036 RepID=A0A0K2TGY7_LEPSM
MGHSPPKKHRPSQDYFNSIWANNRRFLSQKRLWALLRK